jgi:hypothetical protein
MGNAPVSPMQTTPLAEKQIWEQSWFKWCEVLVTIWGLLTPIYAAIQHFWKILPTFPVWDAGAGAPHWFDLILTYFCIPVAVLGLYGFCIGLVLWISNSFTNRAEFHWYSVAIGLPVGTVALIYGPDKDTPGVFFILPFISGLGCLSLLAAGLISKASRRH